LVAGITAFADGPEEMRQVIQHHIGIGVDQIKLSMSGEEVGYESAIFNFSLTSVRSQRSDLLKTATLLMRKLQHVWRQLIKPAVDFVHMLVLVTLSKCAFVMV
jgi:hypothetical protein